MGYLFCALQPQAMLVNVPISSGTDDFSLIDDLEIGLWLPSNPTTANIIDLSHQQHYFDVMPGTDKSLAGGYTIYFHDQHAVTLPNRTVHMLPGNPTWNGDVLVLKILAKMWCCESWEGLSRLHTTRTQITYICCVW